MNNLIYNARMALRDIMEVNIFTRGNDKVYLTVSPDLVWEGAVPESAEERAEHERANAEKVIRYVFERLHDMDLDVADGEAAIEPLLKAQSVEIVRKAA